jgi:hypothetical protein
MTTIWEKYEDYQKHLESELLADDKTTPSESVLESISEYEPPSSLSFTEHYIEPPLLSPNELGLVDPSPAPLLLSLPPRRLLEKSSVPTKDLTLAEFWRNKRPPTPETISPYLDELFTTEKYFLVGIPIKDQLKRIYKVVGHKRIWYYGRRALIYICKSKDATGRKIIVEVEGDRLKPATYAKAAGARARYRKQLGKRI